MSSEPQFLDLKSYRRKRMVEVAKLLPILGGLCILLPLPFLFVVPLDGNATALALYFFAVWLFLVLAALVLARVLGPARPGD